MIVFKAFWKIIKKNKGLIILYTVMLIVFGGMNFKQSEKDNNFSSSKPEIVVINNDKNGILANNLVTYLNNNTIVKDKKSEDDILDALFYRDINYIIEIPENYTIDVLNNNNPSINIQSTGNYGAALAEMILQKYLNVQNIYSMNEKDVNKIISNINESLKIDTKVSVNSKVDTNVASKVSRFYNFASYSLMAVILFGVCLVLSSFKKETINKRTLISSMNYKKHNFLLTLSALSFTLIFWLVYAVLGSILLKNSILNITGVFYLINMLLFSLTTLCLSFIIINLTTNKGAINGIINVISLGPAFLCGAFIPTIWLPKVALNIAHIFPAYYYVNTNDYLSNLESFNLENLKPVLNNFVILFIYVIVFIVINNLLTRKNETY